MARIDELERKFADNPRRYFAPLANEYRKAGNAERAIELCRSQLPEIPGHISGHIVLAQALYDAGHYADSRSAFEAALMLDPENILALRYLGDIARQEGELIEAGRWYGRTLEADPYNEAAAIGLELVRSGSAQPPAQSAEPAESIATASAAQFPEPEQFAPVESAIDSASLPRDDLALAFSRSRDEDGEEEASASEAHVLEVAAPFVTETMADLYLEQGYANEALELLRQLAEQRPGDAALRAKIAGIETQPAAGHDAEIDASRDERTFSDSGGHQSAAPFDPAVAAADRSAFSEPTALSDLLPASYAIEPPLESGGELAQELSGAYESPASLRAESPVEPASTESIGGMEGMSSEIAEPSRERGRTVRDFFADLDRMRPRTATVAAIPASSSPPGGPLEFWENAPVRAEDDAAAREMAGVFAPGPPSDAAQTSPPVVSRPPSASRVSGPHAAFNPATAEMKDFDAWLRGLKTP